MSTSKQTNQDISPITHDELQLLYQLARQATIRITDIKQVYNVLLRVEQILSAR